MIKHFLVIACLISFSLSATKVAKADVLVIHAGTVLAVPGDKPRSEQTIVVRDDRIERIENGYTSPADIDLDAQLIDLKDQFVLPGLMDMHVHLLGQLSKSSRTSVLYDTTSMDALKGAHFANKTLMAGFTTVRDLGGNPEAIFALRDAVARGLVPVPSVSMPALWAW